MLRVALLRAVNVAGHGLVAMADLRDLLGRLACADVQSVLASGNLVFRAPKRSAATLEREFESAAEERLGLRTDFFVRDAAEWRAILAGNPFPEEAERDPGHLVVSFLKDAPSAKAVRALQAAIVGRVRAGKSQVLLHTALDFHRLLDRHVGEQLPRIC